MLPFLQYVLVLFLTYGGIYVGVLLALVARDELKIKKYYSLVRYFIYLVIALYTLAIFAHSPLLIAFFMLLVGMTIFVVRPPDYVMYPVLAGIFYISTVEFAVFFAQSLLIFLVGFPIGTLFVIEKKWTSKKKYKEAFLRLNSYYASYLLLGLLLYFIGPL